MTSPKTTDCPACRGELGFHSCGITPQDLKTIRVDGGVERRSSLVNPVDVLVSSGLVEETEDTKAMRDHCDEDVASRRYRCVECSWEGTEAQMEADFRPTTGENEMWSNHICPRCKVWWGGTDDYDLVTIEHHEA